jgi:hypothetical protein
MTARVFAILLITVNLAACNPNAGKIWMRTDGRSVSSTPELAKQYELDAAICKGEMQKAGLSAGTNYYNGLVPAIAEEQRRGGAMSDVARGCMAQRGYLHVEAEKAQEIASGLAAQQK